MAYIMIITLCLASFSCKLKKRSGPPIQEENPALSLSAKPPIEEQIEDTQTAKTDMPAIEKTEPAAPLVQEKKIAISKLKTPNLSAKDKEYQKGLLALKEGQKEKAKQHFLNACQLGYYDACHKFAYQEHFAGNTANSLRFYRIACQEGSLKSCNNYALASEKLGLIEEAKDYYSKACLDKHQLSCTNLKRVLDEQEKPR